MEKQPGRTAGYKGTETGTAGDLQTVCKNNGKPAVSGKGSLKHCDKFQNRLLSEFIKIDEHGAGRKLQRPFLLEKERENECKK